MSPPESCSNPVFSCRPQGSKVPGVQPPHPSSLSSLMMYPSSELAQPPPAHMGIPPVHIDPKTGKSITLSLRPTETNLCFCPPLGRIFFFFFFFFYYFLFALRFHMKKGKNKRISNELILDTCADFNNGWTGNRFVKVGLIYAYNVL